MGTSLLAPSSTGPLAQHCLQQAQQYSIDHLESRKVCLSKENKCWHSWLLLSQSFWVLYICVCIFAFSRVWSSAMSEGGKSQYLSSINTHARQSPFLWPWSVALKEKPAPRLCLLSTHCPESLSCLLMAAQLSSTVLLQSYSSSWLLYTTAICLTLLSF
jgi:hypothetical protein